MKVLKSILLLLAAFCTILSMQSCEDETEDMMPDCPIGYTGIDCENFDLTEIQFLLNEGITPLELSNGNVPRSSLYGKIYEGGLIFYFNPNDGSGLIAAATDQGEVAWGCSGQIISGADGEDIGTGTQNTLDIMAGCETVGIAARLCNELDLNGRTDWFLPSKDELNLMWINLADSDGNGLNDDPGNLGGFAPAFYWSSTEFEDTRAWYQFFSNSGSQNGDFKSNLNHVRAIRAF